MEKRIRVKDLAPFASFEDLSDERESPIEGSKPKTTLANINEEKKISNKVPTTTATTSVTTSMTNNNSLVAKMNSNVTNATPRIDISRTSSSPYQDDSSPERELILGKAKDSKLEVIFGEEIVSELRSSTEELPFLEEGVNKNRLRKSPFVVSLPDMQRETLSKDSGCTGDLALLSMRTHTNRVSSVGSVASVNSCVSSISSKSHCSAASCLPSNFIRGSSPHPTSVETSFCGTKPSHSARVDDEYAVIYSKQNRLGSISTKTRSSSCSSGDQTSEQKQQKFQTTVRQKSLSKPRSKRPTIENPKTQKFISLYSDEEDKLTVPGGGVAGCDAPATQPQLQSSQRRMLPGLDPRTQIYIPLRGDSVEGRAAAGSSPRKSGIGQTCKPNPFSFKRMKPFTNSILVNFISKYDTRKNAPSTPTPLTSTPPQRMYEEFRRFISLKDDDDPTAGESDERAASSSLQQSKVDLMTVSVQVHRSRSLSDKKPCVAIVDEDIAQLSNSDTRILASTSRLPTNVHHKQPSLHLSDSLLEHRLCSDSSDTKLIDCCNLAMATACSSSSFPSSIVPSHQSLSQFVQSDHPSCGPRPANSKTHLSCCTKYSSSNSPSINVCTASNTASDGYPRNNEYPCRRCS